MPDPVSLLSRQVEELVLLRCSLLPDEILEFVLTSPEDLAQWTKTIEDGSRGEPLLEGVSCPAHFIVKIDGNPLWFELRLSDRYPSDRSDFQVMVRGYDVSRAYQQRWQDIVQDARSHSNEVEFPVSELVSAHLLPSLRAEVCSRSDPIDFAGSTSCSAPESSTRFHALLTSHHLKSPQKRRALQQWSSELRIHGFAKVGHPGIIYCVGIQSDVAEFISRTKDMQWLALRLRFEEPVPEGPTEDVSRGSWIEFQKIGEVLEEMKRLGRESYLLDLGIGSGGR